MTENMIERLRALSASRATDTALVTLDAAGETRYHYADLDRRARAIGARLRGVDGFFWRVVCVPNRMAATTTLLHARCC